MICGDGCIMDGGPPFVIGLMNECLPPTCTCAVVVQQELQAWALLIQKQKEREREWEKQRYIHSVLWSEETWPHNKAWLLESLLKTEQMYHVRNTCVGHVIHLYMYRYTNMVKLHLYVHVSIYRRCTCICMYIFNWWVVQMCNNAYYQEYTS